MRPAPDPGRQDLTADLTAVSRALSCAIVQHASGYMETIAITDWFDEEGDIIPHADVLKFRDLAVTAVAGPDEKGRWWVIDLSEFTVTTAPS